MAPQEKTGDAITVKTPLAVLTPTSEKKQLSDKKVARKTTSAGSSKQAPTIPATRSHDPRPPLNRTSTSDAPSPGTRPLKRPRVSTEGNIKDWGVRRDASLYTNSTSYASPQIKSRKSEEREIEITGFALHPRKAHSSSFEAPPAHRQRGEHKPITKPLHQNVPRKAPFPANDVIDLTGDDPQPKPPPRQISHSTGQQKSHDNFSSGTHARAEEKRSGSRHEGRSIEVQFPANQANKLTWYPHITAQNHPINAGKSTANAEPHLPPKKPPPINIAPRPNPTLLPSNEGTPQFALTKDKQKAPQRPPQQSPLYTGRPPDPPRQNGNQIRHDSLTKAAGVAEETRRVGVTNHVATNHRPASIASSSISTPSTLGANGARTGSRGTENTPQPQTSKEQVDAFIQEILQRPLSKVVSTSLHGNPIEGRTTASDSSLRRPESLGRASPVRQTQDRESNLPKPPNTPEQRRTDPQSSIQHRHNVQKPVHHFPHAFQHVGELNGIRKVTSTPLGKSALASMFPKRNWKNLNVEERRQVLISRHNPVKFDAFIYGKLNEPNRPGSALFDVPEYEQPPRPTRPATHFAHIDPRVHWTHPRSKTWYQEKQDEIRQRGTRKSNFGRATASAARRRQKEEKDNVGVDLPERVKRDPAWLAAIDELDEMADRYHAREREKVRHKAAEQREREHGRNTIDDSDDEMADISS
ncbi:hypothetical protein Hte_010595 [Hypoxylon texense]